MASARLPPFSETPLHSFVKAQFRTKCIPPPSSTNLTGLTAIVTGSSSGIGMETAGLLLEYNLSHIILAVRTVKNGETVAASLRKAHPKAKVEVWQLDMASYDSVQAFAKRCGQLPRLDIAILNAGTSTLEFTIVPSTGHEETIQVNYLSTALLAILLLPVLKPKTASGKPGRMLIVASGLALTSKFTNRNANPLLPSFDESTGANVGAALERYSVSKTLVLMLVNKLAQLVSAKDVIINTVEPGLTAGSGLQRNATAPIRIAFWVIKSIAGRSLRQAAWSYADAAVVKGEETHGSLVLNWEISPCVTYFF